MKRRVRLGSGLDPQKLADTVKQAGESFERYPGVSVDAHGVDEGWIHIVPQAGQDGNGDPTQVIGWLVTFGYPHDEPPADKLGETKIALPEGYKLAAWEAAMYASLWLPADTSPDTIAHLIIALARDLHRTTNEQHVEIALEYGL